MIKNANNLKINAVGISKVTLQLGHGGGLVVSVVAFYSNHRGSNAGDYYNFLYKKTNINDIVAGVSPPLKK